MLPVQSERPSLQMKVFNDYDFLAQHVKAGVAQAPHLVHAAETARRLKVKSILDIGGGSSTYITLLSDACDSAVVDISKKSLEAVRTKMKAVGALPHLPVRKTFDFVSALELLEHLQPDVYDESLREISRVSNRYIIVTAPFLQDLSAALVRCEACGSEFQCEGHWRSYGLKELFGLQQYFGGLSELYFAGKSKGNYYIYLCVVRMKGVVRRILQKSVRGKYCRPPFTKCPTCGNEIFNDYNEYANYQVTSLDNECWERWSNGGRVAGRFAALYDKTKPKLKRYADI